ncbi:hypothetical protein [Fundidesulfovibrio putealis]|uniref:hypothetical protein n=1 Tax=Fundidesulfovibrio putealis TaxID=270496 RepID=UPI0012EC6744|nr:hypothetical protein [Fundidesulfovibrio putealis]
MFAARLLPTILIVLLGMLAAGSICLADDHRDHDGHKNKKDGYHEADHGKNDDEAAEDRERGGEEAGVVAAIVFSVANATVAFSILRRLFLRISPKNVNFNNNLVKADVYQKKLFLPLHYYLNLVGVGIVLWHWFALRCEKSVIPEVGAVLLMLLCVLGVIVKFKLSKGLLVPFAKSIHMSSISAAIIIATLFVGHVAVD